MAGRFFYFILFISLIPACGGRKEAHVGGIAIPAGLLQFADESGFDYTGNLHKALSDDGEALQSLLVFSGKTKEEDEAAHGGILHQVLQRRGDNSFAEAVNGLSAENRMFLLAEMQSKGKKWRDRFPETWLSFFPNKKIKEHRGLYIFSRIEQDVFRSCEKPSEKWVAIDETGEVEVNYLKVLQKPYPGQAMAMEARGFFTPSYGEENLPTNFSGFFVVMEVMGLEMKNHENTCVPFELWGVGEEKEWQLQISGVERLIEFKSPERTMLHHFPFSELVETDTGLVCSSVNEETGDNIHIVVKEGKCGFEMDTIGLSKKVSVVMNGHSFSGCGFSNVKATPQN